MDISKVKNIKFLGSFMKKHGNYSKNKWYIDWEQSEIKNIKKEDGRIYLIVVDGIIKKIGKSECKGGMRNTFQFYQGGLSGSPSIRTFGIHHLIYNELNLDKKVDIYGLWVKKIKVKIDTLFGTEIIETNPSIGIVEEKCREEYRSSEGRYPDWNFQENGEKWPEMIQEMYKKQFNNR